MDSGDAASIRARVLNTSLAEAKRHGRCHVATSRCSSTSERSSAPSRDGPGKLATDSGPLEGTNVAPESLSEIEPCVVCLEQVAEQATAQPCGHNNFDFLCLLGWLERQIQCPLCKTEINSVRYRDTEGIERVYSVQEPSLPIHRHTPGIRVRQSSDRRFCGPRRPQRISHQRLTPDAALIRRRNVYRYHLYSLHVGSNRVSAYKNLSPSDFTSDPSLMTRARSWIRRELRVFGFLEDGSTADATTSQQSLRTASNAEFLLEYVVAILKTVDIRDASGHAEDLVAEFLGRNNSRLFLHELNSWLRSPYESLDAWDRHVQYPEAPCDFSQSKNPTELITRPNDTYASFRSQGKRRRNSHQTSSIAGEAPLISKRTRIHTPHGRLRNADRRLLERRGASSAAS